MPDSR